MVAAPAGAVDDSGAALKALVQARVAEENGQPAAALSALGSLASHAPQLPGLRARMLEQAIQAGDLVAARGAAAHLWESGERRFDAQLVLVVDAMRRSDWKTARAYLAGRSDKTGGDAISRLLQPTFSAWIDLGAREKEPERHLLAASGRARPEPALLMEAALVRLAGGRTADAVALADDVVLTDRTSQLVALRLATSLVRSGQDAAAERLRSRIALAAGGREDPMLALSDQPVTSARAGAAHWLSLLADGLGRTPNANPTIPLVFARSAYWLNDQDPFVRSALADTLDRNGQSEGALALLAASRAPVPPVLAMRRAEILADTGDMPGAVTLAAAAAAGEPPVRGLLIRYAEIARRAKDPEAARTAYARLEAALGDGEEDRALRGSLLIARAELLIDAGDWAAARPLLEQAVAMHPNDANILNFAGYAAIERREDVARSLARIEAAWEQEPQSAAITDSLGWAYFLTGRVDEAVPLLEKAQAGAPDNAVIVEHLGDAYWQAGRKFQARYAWRAAALLAEADMATRISTKLRDGLTAATTAP